jgi:pimeloyl-ACP methyl ester carboxylesterase
MPTFTRGDVSIYYEETGSGFPVLLFAPGGTRSSIPLWGRAPFHPVRELSAEHRVVAVDQRNAGRSRAPVRATDGWATYAEDHVALLDGLGIPRCHVLGMCAGAAFALRLAIAAPERVAAAVLLQPIGLTDTNRELFFTLFDEWAADLRRDRPEIDPGALDGLKHRLFGGAFAFSVSSDEVRRCATPILVLRGNDAYHPAAISDEIVHLAPNAEMITSWKEGDDVPRALERVRAFLREASRRG